MILALGRHGSSDGPSKLPRKRVGGVRPRISGYVVSGRGTQRWPPALRLAVCASSPTTPACKNNSLPFPLSCFSLPQWSTKMQVSLFAEFAVGAGSTAATRAVGRPTRQPRGSLCQGADLRTVILGPPPPRPERRHGLRYAGRSRRPAEYGNWPAAFRPADGCDTHLRMGNLHARRTGAGRRRPRERRATSDECARIFLEARPAAPGHLSFATWHPDTLRGAVPTDHIERAPPMPLRQRKAPDRIPGRSSVIHAPPACCHHGLLAIAVTSTGNAISNTLLAARAGCGSSAYRGRGRPRRASRPWAGYGPGAFSLLVLLGVIGPAMIIPPDQ